MLMKIRLGCLGIFVLAALALLVFWKPISTRMTEWMFASTTEMVAEAMPDGRGEEAVEVCEALWRTLRSGTLGPEHREAVDTFREEAFAMLKNNEVTADEAVKFVERARALLREIDPDALPGIPAN